MARVIQEHIKKPLADLVLFGALSKGGTAVVRLKEDRTSLEVSAEEVVSDATVEA
jgi:ATP-dependent Clp protease ATP-binding subunit ClpA